MGKLAVFALLLLLIVGAAYEALIYYDNNFRLGRMWETPAVRPHEAELISPERGAVPVGGGEAIFRVTDARLLSSPLSDHDAAGIELGKSLYLTYCGQCHGKYHDGNGTVGQSFHPLPSDLRSPEVQALDEGMLFKEISYGTPKKRQPPLATTIDMTDRWRIAAYVKSLGPRD